MPLSDARIEHALAVLQRHHGDDAARAREAIARATADIGTWTESLLTSDGSPFELTFSSRGGVRWTAEVAAPSVPPLMRTAMAFARCDAAGSEMRTRVDALQQLGDLRFGAWIGGSHQDGRDSSKIYCEVPRPSRLRLIGIDPRSERIESYWRAPDGLSRAARAEILRDRDLTSETFEEFVATQRLGAMFERACGFSVTEGAVSFFTFADALWGDEESIRAEVLRLFRMLAFDGAAYEEIREPKHGMFAVIVSAAGIEVRAGLAPG